MNRIVGTEHRGVLVVDDDVELCALIKAILETEGHRVLCQHDGEAALNSLNHWVPSIILLDKSMPVMDGDLFFDRVKAHVVWRNYPIIFITGSIATGPWVSYETKPLDADSLLAAIRKYAVK